jgi:peptide/nickel transport system substrate-binding protein
VRSPPRSTARRSSRTCSPLHGAYEPDVRRTAYDPAAARRLLDEAGHPDPDGDGPGVRFRLSYKTTTVASRRRLAEAIQAELADVGIGIDIQSSEWATFYDDVRNGRFQLHSLAWVGVADPDIYFTTLASTMVPPLGNNRGAFSDPEIDRLTLTGRRTFDPGERQRIYSAVQKRAAEVLPVVPLWWTDNVAVHDERLCGFVPAPDGDLASLRTAWWLAAPPTRGAGACGCAAGGA